jgi:hypothetical protein
MYGIYTNMREANKSWDLAMVHHECGGEEFLTLFQKVPAPAKFKPMSQVACMATLNRIPVLAL